MRRAAAVALALALLTGCGGGERASDSSSPGPRVARFVEHRVGPLNRRAAHLIGRPPDDARRAGIAAKLDRDATAAVAELEPLVGETDGDVRDVVVTGVIVLELLARCGARAEDYFSRPGVRSPNKICRQARAGYGEASGLAQDIA